MFHNEASCPVLLMEVLLPLDPQHRGKLIALTVYRCHAECCISKSESGITLGHVSIWGRQCERLTVELGMPTGREGEGRAQELPDGASKTG